MSILHSDKQKKRSANYISAKEMRAISRQNRRITSEIEKRRNRKNVPESEYVTAMQDPANVVEFDNLHTYFFTDIGTVKAVDGVTFAIPQGKTVGVVGESGCGKSVTSLSLMQLVQRPQGQIVEGAIRLNLGDKAVDIAKMPTEAMQKIRGKAVSMIFQEPMTSLNPVFRIGMQLDEVISLHNPEMSKDAVKARSIDMLEKVGIANSNGVYAMFPHELSGGMRQRVMIAMALACDPKLIIADEPTTALDVTIQAQILELMQELKNKLNTSIIMITHDLGVIASMCSRIVVMYGGCVAETGTVREIFYEPRHPYTWGLLRSIPKAQARDAHTKLVPIPGTPPDMLRPPKGCPFAPRCRYAMQVCREYMAPETVLSDTHRVACHLMHKNAPSVTREDV